MTNDDQTLFAILVALCLLPLLTCLLLVLLGYVQFHSKEDVSGVVLDRRHVCFPDQSGTFWFDDTWQIKVQTLDGRIVWVIVTEKEHESHGIGSWWEGRPHD